MRASSRDFNWLGRLRDGAGRRLILAHPKSDRKVNALLCLSSIILSPLDSNVKMSPYDTGDNHVE